MRIEGTFDFPKNHTTIKQIPMYISISAFIPSIVTLYATAYLKYRPLATIRDTPVFSNRVIRVYPDSRNPYKIRGMYMTGLRLPIINTMNMYGSPKQFSSPITFAKYSLLSQGTPYYFIIPTARASIPKTFGHYLENGSVTMNSIQNTHCTLSKSGISSVL